MQINLLAVFIITIFTFILGGLWYSKILFGNLFIKHIGKSENELQQNSSGLFFLYELIATFITNYVLASLILMMNTSDFWRGFQLGIIVWIGFIAMTQLSTVTFEKRNFTIYLIHIFYRLIAVSISGGILAIWK